MKFREWLHEAEKKLSPADKKKMLIAKATLKVGKKVGKAGMTPDDAKKFLKSIGYTDQEIKKLEK